MTDQQQILQTFNKHFEHRGQVSVDAQGLISCTGKVKLTTRVERLPCAFLKVDGFFDCSYSSIQTLEGAPQIVGGKFSASNCILATLEGAPRKCGGFWVLGNQLQNLKGGPDWVDGNYLCHSNPLTSLEGLARHISKQFRCDITPDLGLLRILQTGTDEFFDLAHVNRPPLTIINKYLDMGGGWNRMVPCARELIWAGFPGNAKL